MGFSGPLRGAAFPGYLGGSCAASGLLLLAQKVDPSEAATYRNWATRILESLYRNYGAWADESQEGLLLHGMGHYPERQNVDVPLIYGDFFYVEGLARLLEKGPFYWE